MKKPKKFVLPLEDRFLSFKGYKAELSMVESDAYHKNLPMWGDK